MTEKQRAAIAKMKQPAILCHPDDAERYAAMPVPVRASPFVPPGKVFVFDEHGIKSMEERAAAKPTTFDEPLWLRPSFPGAGASVSWVSAEAALRAAPDPGRSPFMATNAPALEIEPSPDDEEIARLMRPSSPGTPR